MKIARLINAILYLITLVFQIISIFNKEDVFRIMATAFLIMSSVMLLIVSVIQLRKDKKQ